MPNGIPSISEASGLVYGAGQREGQWGLEGLDFETGDSRVWVEAGPGACLPAHMAVLSILPGVAVSVTEDGVPNTVIEISNLPSYITDVYLSGVNTGNNTDNLLIVCD